MANNRIGEKLQHLHRSGQKGLAWLIDPEKYPKPSQLKTTYNLDLCSKVDLILIGGSLMVKSNMDSTLQMLRNYSEEVPLVIFPGNVIQVSPYADGILFLSLISGRNPEFLIGQQVTAAPLIAHCRLEALATAYLLIGGGEISSVHYMSQSLPIPMNKPNIAMATALAGKYLGMNYFFLDAGSGSKTPVPSAIIRTVKKHTQSPILVGGGIDSLEKAKAAWEAGADLVVMGNGVEKNPGLLTEVLDYLQVFNVSLNIN
ncbi:geranylgeranylglyceryl/heptaprenylglyceryl phosphate synthase [Pararhodonellum marinum]|uniref:geranylgeranylglyceryl/heptaprenylglyceryl phosphate synthase n=1 Tax=Pararhodonellum marinum TaxID=2755358 RepID=UPI00188FB35D|nr:geranylgeranylglyceryl/heptaprenylglyceryl phosphate synthase [Pararhodonellum marinum]